MKRHSLLLLLVAGILALGASCPPQAPSGATLGVLSIAMSP